jgi:hypothetical protein
MVVKSQALTLHGASPWSTGSHPVEPSFEEVQGDVRQATTGMKELGVNGARALVT